MPEGPEVETVRRGLSPALHRCFVEVGTFQSHVFRRQDHQEVADSLLGHSIARLDRFGKYLLARLSSGETLAVHLRMSGRFFLAPVSNPDYSHVHLRALLEDGRTLLYIDPRSFGELFVFSSATQNEIFPEFGNLGPDVLRSPPSPELLASLFAGRSRQVKAVLLDQSVLAGIGNIYADEALFAAGIHPETPVGSIAPHKIFRLAKTIDDVISSAVARGGSTLSDGSYRKPDGTPGNGQDRHKVFGRAGLECYVCQSELEKSRVAGRGTTTCPQCQPHPRLEFA
jgi:formamidopyrimidine-DNA glycosylase